jgi:hypothetical protein
MEYFKKIYIKSEADLPKEDGEYLSFHEHALLRDAISYRKFIFNDPQSIALWVHCINWYLQPLPQPREVTDDMLREIVASEKDKIRKELMKGHNMCIAEGVRFSELHWMNLIYDVAKIVRDQMKGGIK